MAMIDFHSHILPKMDDGSRSSEMTEAMLQTAAEQGIGIMVATPHFYADSMAIYERQTGKSAGWPHGFREKIGSVYLDADR